MTTKGQSAIEYLTTYGWMLLVIAIVGGTVFSVVQDSGQSQSVSGMSDADVRVEDFGLTDSGLGLELRGVSADEVENVNVSLVDQGTGEKVYSCSEETISVAGSETVSVAGVESSENTDTYTIEIRYDSGGLTGLVVNGSLSGGFSLNDSISCEDISDSDGGSDGSTTSVSYFNGFNQFRSDARMTGTSETTGVSAPVTEKWYQSTGGESSPAVVDGTVYVGSDDGNVYALNASTGDKKWNHSTGDSIYSGPAVVDDTVYVGSRDEKVYALNASTGDQKWNHSTGRIILSSPTVVDGTVYLSNNIYDVYALDASTGNKEWSKGSGSQSSPVVVDGTVFVGSDDGNVYALDASTGAEEWNYSSGGSIYSGPAVVDGTVFVGSDDGNVYALDASTGAEEWNYSTGQYIESSPAVVNGTVYVGSNDGNVYALDASTGNEEWSHDTGCGVSSSPTVVEDTVYVGSGVTEGPCSSNEIYSYALDASTGDQKWNYSDGNPIMSSPAVVNGTVFGSSKGGVYALETDYLAPSFSVSDDRPDIGESVTFDASSTESVNSVSSYEWLFGDGSSGSGEVVSHSYSSEGYYDVELSVSDGTRSESVVKTVGVNKSGLENGDFETGDLSGWNSNNFGVVSEGGSYVAETQDFSVFPGDTYVEQSVRILNTGTLSFDWYVDGNTDYSSAVFKVNGTGEISRSDSNGWVSDQFQIDSTGETILRWEGFTKVDNVTYTPS